jgi:hypothetical protein
MQKDLVYQHNPFLIDDEQLQHLYIISDDEIEVNDYFIGGGSLYKFTEDDVKNGFKPKGEKVITTTDVDIIFPVNKFPHLPQIPESFILAYIKAYEVILMKTGGMNLLING